MTYVKALRILLTVRLGNALVLHSLKDTWHRSNQCQGDARMLVGAESHHFIGPLLVRDHGQCSLGILVVNGIINGTHVQHIVDQLAAHGHEHRDGVWLVLHGSQV